MVTLSRGREIKKDEGEPIIAVKDEEQESNEDEEPILLVAEEDEKEEMTSAEAEVSV